MELLVQAAINVPRFPTPLVACERFPLDVEGGLSYAERNLQKLSRGFFQRTTNGSEIPRMHTQRFSSGYLKRLISCTLKKTSNFCRRKAPAYDQQRVNIF